MTFFRPSPRMAAGVLAVTTLLSIPAFAGPGHDHSHDPAAPTSAGTALPRFAAASDLFELVGVLEGRQLTLYLDRAADNVPIPGAQIELEIGGAKLRPAARDDVYELTLPAAPKPGVLPVTATVTAGTDIDLLAGELDIPAAAPHAGEAAQDHGGPGGWTGGGWVAGGIGGLLALIALLVVARRTAANRQTRTGAAP